MFFDRACASYETSLIGALHDHTSDAIALVALLVIGAAGIGTLLAACWRHQRDWRAVATIALVLGIGGVVAASSAAIATRARCLRDRGRTTVEVHEERRGWPAYYRRASGELDAAVATARSPAVAALDAWFFAGCAGLIAARRVIRAHARRLRAAAP